jgi:hypothetical protein
MTIPRRKNYKPTEFKVNVQDRFVSPKSTLSKEDIRIRCREACNKIKNANPEENFAFLRLIDKIIRLKNKGENKNRAPKEWSKKHFETFFKKNHIDLANCHPMLRFKLQYLQEAYEREVANINTVSKLLINTENKRFISSCLSFNKTKRNSTATQLANCVSSRVHDKIDALYESLNNKLKEVILYLKEQDYDNITPRTDLLREWCQEHWANPYPSEVEKKRLAYLANMLPKQLSTWFGNYRGRYRVKLEARIKDTTHWLKSRDAMVAEPSEKYCQSQEKVNLSHKPQSTHLPINTKSSDQLPSSSLIDNTFLDVFISNRIKKEASSM